MGADLNTVIKCQALSDDHVKFLVYQLMRGLKVKPSIVICYLKLNTYSTCKIVVFCTDIFTIDITFQYIHSCGIIHRVSLPLNT